MIAPKMRFFFDSKGSAPSLEFRTKFWERNPQRALVYKSDTRDLLVEDLCYLPPPSTCSTGFAQRLCSNLHLLVVNDV